MDIRASVANLSRTLVRADDTVLHGEAREVVGLVLSHGVVGVADASAPTLRRTRMHCDNDLPLPQIRPSHHRPYD